MFGFTRRPLVLNVVARHLRRDMIDQARLSQAEAEIKRLTQTVRARAEHKCEFCGYHEDAEMLRQISLSAGSSRLQSHLEVVPLDGDITNTVIENLGVACSFCAPVLSLNATPPGQIWHLAWLPGYEQPWISLLAASVVHVDRLLMEHERHIEEGGLYGGATMKQYFTMLRSIRPTIKTSLRDQVAVAKSMLGHDSMSDFAAALERLGHEAQQAYAQRATHLAGFVLLPDGLLTNNWAGFEGSFEALAGASAFTGLRSLLDLAALGRQSFQIAIEHGWPPKDMQSLDA